ncbi:MAG: 1-acyl-sn-glycerol-3-phosphate acyltransferase [Bacteroidetes bacterium]|nr:1-acyl-sn-glycerol-3-phosphate acyltransferase [Bacteroidota bacterium]
MFWYNLLRSYVRLGLKFYFRRIIINGAENIPDHAVIYAANHQNAFMDALLIICFNPHLTNSLARADIFKKPVARRLLNWLRLIPVYRIRDGWQSLDQNHKSFEECTRRFEQKEAVIIFPEGNHGPERRLRPLSRGFTRLAYEALKIHPGLPLSVIPVGLNYSAPQVFRSDVSIYFGKPISVSAYFQDPLAVSANRFRDRLTEDMQHLITHVDQSLPYEKVMEELKASGADFVNPEETNKRITQIASGHKLAIGTNRKKANVFMAVLRSMAMVIHLVPMLSWHVIRNRIKDPVFHTSIRFAMGIFAIPLWYFAGWLSLFLVFGWMKALVFLLISLISLPMLLLRQPSE